MNQLTQGTERTDSVSIQEERLVTVLHSLEAQIERQNSLKYTLVRGMVYGLGTVIGATVLVAIFGGILAGFINSVTGQEIISQQIIDGN